jgi:hypothetical protein
MDLFPLSEAEERAHRDHPDFRVGGKIFATLGYPDKSCGMVKLSPEEQRYFSKARARCVRSREKATGDAAAPPAFISKRPGKKR